MTAAYWCEHGWLPPGRLASGVVVTVAGERVTAVESGVTRPPPGAERLWGLVLPGLANAHSHAFHRALRGRTQAGRGTFWTWRERMYELATRLDPDSYLALARATYAEMALAGVTCVGEFHYLHHGPGGTPYDDPNLMGHVLVEAAREAGLRITLLDTCYLTGDIDRPLQGPQLRFGDRNADSWAIRVEELADTYDASGDVVCGAAIHSVRAVPRDQMGRVAAWATQRPRPLHVHLSEQRAENAACRAAYGATPTRVLHDAGVLGPRTSVVHATHVAAEDIALVGAAQTCVCMCPTTERDLGDGIGPARRLYEAGSPVSLGSDSHAVIDLFEEARVIELNERLANEERGHWAAAELLAAATRSGHASLGSAPAGTIAPGSWADLVAVRLASPRTAGADLANAAETVVFAAAAADVTDVVASGRRIVAEGVHMLGDVGALLHGAIGEVTT